MGVGSEGRRTKAQWASASRTRTPRTAFLAGGNAANVAGRGTKPRASRFSPSGDAVRVQAPGTSGRARHASAVPGRGPCLLGLPAPVAVLTVLTGPGPARVEHRAGRA